MVLNKVQMVPHNQSNLAQMVPINNGKINQSTKWCLQIKVHSMVPHNKLQTKHKWRQSMMVQSITAQMVPDSQQI